MKKTIKIILLFPISILFVLTNFCDMLFTIFNGLHPDNFYMTTYPETQIQGLDYHVSKFIIQFFVNVSFPIFQFFENLKGLKDYKF